MNKDKPLSEKIIPCDADVIISDHTLLKVVDVAETVNSSERRIKELINMEWNKGMKYILKEVDEIFEDEFGVLDNHSQQNLVRDKGNTSPSPPSCRANSLKSDTEESLQPAGTLRGCGKELGNCKCGEYCDMCDEIHYCTECSKEKGLCKKCGFSKEMHTEEGLDKIGFTDHEYAWETMGVCKKFEEVKK